MPEEVGTEDEDEDSLAELAPVSRNLAELQANRVLCQLVSRKAVANNAASYVEWTTLDDFCIDELWEMVRRKVLVTMTSEFGELMVAVPLTALRAKLEMTLTDPAFMVDLLPNSRGLLTKMSKLHLVAALLQMGWVVEESPPNLTPDGRRLCAVTCCCGAACTSSSW